LGIVPPHILSREAEKSANNLNLKISLNLQHSERIAIMISSIVFLFLNAWQSRGIHCIYAKLVADPKGTIM
jgi:hypothetical protein